MSDPHVYPGTNVLINKFGIQDKEKLSYIERNYTGFRAYQLTVNPIEGNFDFEHFKKNSLSFISGYL